MDDRLFEPFVWNIASYLPKTIPYGEQVCVTLKFEMECMLNEFSCHAEVRHIINCITLG